MIIVHSFLMGDVEDPELYAAVPLLEWERSDKGQWVMKHAVEPPTWHRFPDPVNYCYKFVIKAKLNKEDELYYRLKWGT